MDKILSFFIVILYALGVLGGIGFSLYGGSWPVAVAIAVLGWMAFPRFKEAWQDLAGDSGKGEDEDEAA